MAVFSRLLVLVALAAACVALMGCERTITYSEVTQEPQSCFECHSDQNTELVAAEQQWQNSTHASGDHIDRKTASCAGCHTSEGFLNRVAGVPVVDVPNPTTIHCFTCHAPHTTGNFGLRWTAAAVLKNGVTFDLKDGNLCVACHQSRTDSRTITGRVTMTTRFGPHHGPQGDMIIGSNGYQYAGYTYETTQHRTAVDQACAGCHVLEATNNNVVGGHTFAMRGELDGEELLNTRACFECHGALTTFNYNGVQDSVTLYVNELETILTTAGLMENGAPKATTTGKDSAGAVWNIMMVKEDQSLGVHNAKYTLGLLKSAIKYMRGELPQPGPMVVSRD